MTDVSTPLIGPPSDFTMPAFRSPSSAGQSPVPAGATAHLGLTYAMPAGYREIGMDVYVPTQRTEPAPCVVWIHGGAWLFGDRRYLPDLWPTGELLGALVDRGYAVATIDYRHVREAVFPAQLHDAKAAVRYLRRFADELGIDPERLAVWGESAGGHLAALVGLVSGRTDLEGTDGVSGVDSAVAAVVDWYGVSDVRTMPSLSDSLAAMAGENPAEAAGDEPIELMLAGALDPDTAARDLSPVCHVSASAPPFLLVHGDADGLVPIEQSERLRDRLLEAGADVTFRSVPGADHVFIGADTAPLIRDAIDFLDTILKP